MRKDNSLRLLGQTKLSLPLISQLGQGLKLLQEFDKELQKKVRQRA